MSTSTAPPRPSQVTFAGILTIGASVIAVVMAFAEVSQVGSLETQESISRFLDGGPGQSLGLSLAEVQDVLRIASTIAAGCAAATAVLGWFVLQGSRSSRLALSVLAVPLLASGLFSGGFASAVVAASATMLWLQPARGWFNGEAPAPREATAPPRPAAVLPGSATPVRTETAPPPLTSPLTPPLTPSSPVAAPARRPAAVGLACALTWTFCSLFAVLLVYTAVELSLHPAEFLDQAHKQNPDLAEQGITDGVLRGVLYGMLAAILVWALAAAGLAVLAWRRSRWAVVALLVSAGIAGGTSLLLSLVSPVLLLFVAACAATLVLLLRPDVRRWYAAPR